MSTRILTTVGPIFVNVENIDERRGSSVLGMASSPPPDDGSDNIISKGAATARECSAMVRVVFSLMMHPTTEGDPSKA